MCLFVFDALKEYWNSAEFKDKSEKAKKNRASDVRGSTHTCSSIPMSEHKKRLLKQFGRPPTHTELFFATHRKRDSSGFVDRRSEDIYANFQTQQQEALSQVSAFGQPEDNDAIQPSQPVIDERLIWLEVAGGKKKGRIYGIGSEAYAIFGSYYLPPPSPPLPSSSSLTEQIQEAVRTTIEPFHDRLSALEGRLSPLPPSSSSPPPDPSDH
ncbi:uncharacterized protein LOC127787620 [Diospyros lotus]|uniref:uncharacterized protein LOC127787620 n=1 Tax=Diospyros lotus TaxID=55363 RepID=UPI002255914D|nr:uncharacterized protein LOC127787620 [Diospyros lotus]